MKTLKDHIREETGNWINGRDNTLPLEIKLKVIYADICRNINDRVQRQRLLSKGQSLKFDVKHESIIYLEELGYEASPLMGTYTLKK